MLQRIIKEKSSGWKQLTADINSKLRERTKRANKRNYVGSSKRSCGNIFLLLSFNWLKIKLKYVYNCVIGHIIYNIIYDKNTKEAGGNKDVLEPKNVKPDGNTNLQEEMKRIKWDDENVLY